MHARGPLANVIRFDQILGIDDAADGGPASQRSGLVLKG
jgi:hypothetical protein